MQLRQILILEKCNYGKFLYLKNATTVNSYAGKMQLWQILMLGDSNYGNYSKFL